MAEVMITVMATEVGVIFDIIVIKSNKNYQQLS